MVMTSAPTGPTRNTGNRELPMKMYLLLTALFLSSTAGYCFDGDPPAELKYARRSTREETRKATLDAHDVPSERINALLEYQLDNDFPRTEEDKYYRIVTLPLPDGVQFEPGGIEFDEKGRILTCRRPSQDAWAGWWEFPGGKVDEGESASAALVRELMEEIGISSNPRNLVESTTFEYEDRTVRLQIWNCGIVDEKEIILNEHDESRWLSRDELMDVKWLPADLPIISRWSLEGIPN